MEIIYEDSAILVCYKPAGIAAETGRIGQQDMVSLLRNYRAGKGEPPYIGMVHRLDQPVEGLLVFGKTQRAAGELSRQAAGRSLGKYYCAVGQCAAEGRPEDADKSSGEWISLTDYIVFDKKRNLSMIADPGAPQAKQARLDYRVAGRRDDLVCLDIVLHTGRHHQIRLQMAHHGLPLAGDSKYGRTTGLSDESRCSRTAGLPRERGHMPPGGTGRAEPAQLALCAYRLTFVHPVTKKEMEFSVRPRNPVFELFPCPVSYV